MTILAQSLFLRLSLEGDYKDPAACDIVQCSSPISHTGAVQQAYGMAAKEMSNIDARIVSVDCRGEIIPISAALLSSVSHSVKQTIEEKFEIEGGWFITIQADVPPGGFKLLATRLLEGWDYDKTLVQCKPYITDLAEAYETGERFGIQTGFLDRILDEIVDYWADPGSLLEPFDELQEHFTVSARSKRCFIMLLVKFYHDAVKKVEKNPDEAAGLDGEDLCALQKAIKDMQEDPEVLSILCEALVLRKLD